MSAGNRRRRNGQGKRPGDTTIRISRETKAALEQLRQVYPYDGWSADAVFRDLLVNRLSAVGRLAALGDVKVHTPRSTLEASEKVYTPSGAH